MFFKYLDFLSPKVTFYHKGLLSHSSILSGIISVISVICIIVFAVYYSLDIINRNNPKAFYLHNFLKDAGEYQFNTTTLFHFVNVVRNFRDIAYNEVLDFTVFSIVGAQLYVNNYLNTAKLGGLSSFDHWLYGYCDKNTNTKNLDDLINYDFFEHSACIKTFYNHTEGKYYDIGHPNFRWPSIAHGTYNDQNKIYGLYIQKCNNNLINKILGEGHQCKSDPEINAYMKIQGTRLFHFYFVNNYVNVLNYETPFLNYFYRIESPFNLAQYTAHDINLSPANITTHDGLVFDHVGINISYIFEKDDVNIRERGDKDLYTAYCFFLKNLVEYYERTYKRIQDVISEIGGISQAVTIIAICINSMYNNYVVLSDTELLLHSCIFTENEIFKKKSVLYNNTQHQHQHHLKNKIKTTDKINQNTRNKKKCSDRGNLQSGTTVEKVKINDISENLNISKNKSKNTHISSTDNNMDNIIDNRKNRGSTDIIEKKIIRTVTLRSKNEKDRNFWNYLYFKLTCGKKNMFYKVYEEFRIKIISEEHIIRNHLNIYSLLKITERKRHSRRNSYQIKDLINLI